MTFWLQRNLPRLVVAPSFAVILWFIYGFVLWTIYISFTKSKLLPKYEFWGLQQHFRLWSNSRWHLAVENLLVFTILFLVLGIFIGILLAILLDQKIRAEGFLRTVYLYPMALSFIVTGTAWKWVLNPTLGIQKVFQDLGFTDFTFDWLVNREMVIYTIDGAGLFSIYVTIVLPMLRPVFMSAIVILCHISIKSYDLVIALTAGGPGISSDMPAVFMTQMAFHRSEVGLASASAVVMFATVAAVIVPYLYSELRREDVH